MFGSNSSQKNLRSIVTLSNLNIFQEFLKISIDIDQYFKPFFVELNHINYSSGGKEMKKETGKNKKKSSSRKH